MRATLLFVVLLVGHAMAQNSSTAARVSVELSSTLSGLATAAPASGSLAASNSIPLTSLTSAASSSEPRTTTPVASPTQAAATSNSSGTSVTPSPTPSHHPRPTSHPPPRPSTSPPASTSPPPPPSNGSGLKNRHVGLAVGLTLTAVVIVSAAALLVGFLLWKRYSRHNYSTLTTD